SALRQATTPVNIRGGFLGGCLRETENVAGRMVAEYVPESLAAAIKTANEEGVLMKESPTRETQKRASAPWGFVNYDYFMAYA
ncbi:MAG: hypothetical protein EZS28_028793, partial [Streblomastix strix]